VIDYFVLSPYGKKNGLLMTLLWKKALIIRRNTSYFVGVFSELIFYLLIVRTQNSDFLRFSGKIKRAPQTEFNILAISMNINSRFYRGF